MKNIKDIAVDEEEIVQFVKDAGIEIFTPKEAASKDDSTLRTIQDQMDWVENRLRTLDDLYNVAVELDARETSSNCIVRDLISLTWDEVCDRGIELLQKLKEPWEEIR